MISNIEQPRHYKRKRVLVDPSLQGALIFAFVILETIILGASLAYLYWRFGLVLDNLTYQTHFENVPSLGHLFLIEGIKVILACTVVNGCALLIADRVWRWHVARVLEQFRQTLARISVLDFHATDNPQNESPGTSHEVASFTAKWFELERAKLREVNRRLCLLESVSPTNQVDIKNALDGLAEVIGNRRA